jgi:putative DNA methylase
LTIDYKKKLIEVAIPLDAINAASAREKSIRHGHPSTLHLWWARRPLAACRAVLFAQLVDDPSSHPDVFTDEHSIEKERKRLFKIIEDLVIWENSTNDSVLELARAEIRKSCGGELPHVYDPFSGGGSIPLEAHRLGMPASGSDLNPVAVMIGKAMIEIPPLFRDQPPVHPGPHSRTHYRHAEGLAEDVLWYARELNELAWGKIGHLYPTITLAERDGGTQATVLAWIWARTVASPNPAMGGAHVPLISSFWLCRKPKRQAWVQPVVDGREVRFEVCHGAPADEAAVSAGTKAGRGANFRCLLTGDAITAEYVKSEGMAGRMSWRLLAVVAEGKKGRRYVAPTPKQEAIAFSEKPVWRPEYPLSQHPQYMSVTNYGPTHVSDLFMDRQTIALTTFLDLIPDVTESISDLRRRQAVATYLVLAVSRLANRQSTSTFWDTGAENIQQVFAMQALPMRWETAEGNPFSTSSGNFIGQVEYLAKNVASFPCYSALGSVKNIAAQHADFTNAVISTDPPYYDNVPYADLSDFFYVWLKRGLASFHPDLFRTVLVPKGEELVADHKRHGGRDEADKFFLDGMTEVMQHMASQGRKDVPAAIYYAFRQGEVDEGGLSSKGWATFLQSIVNAGYQITATWPVRTELVGNLKKNKNALATSVVLACRARPDDSATISKLEFVRILRRELPAALKEMHRANISPVDIPQASIGPGIGAARQSG